MMAARSNNQNYDNLSRDESFDYDEFFSSSLNFTRNDGYVQDFSMDIAQHERTLLPSEVDLQDSQTSATNSPQTESPLGNLVCGVCNAPAHGYNFDQITCESCKAFFRRNALQPKPNLKCRFSGSCVIDVHTRRQCTYCRLKKCFDIKMRKDWIRTDEEMKLRQLQKLAKEQKKLNNLTTDPQSLSKSSHNDTTDQSYHDNTHRCR